MTSLAFVLATVIIVAASNLDAPKWVLPIAWYALYWLGLIGARAARESGKE